MPIEYGMAIATLPIDHILLEQVVKPPKDLCVGGSIKRQDEQTYGVQPDSIDGGVFLIDESYLR